MGSLAKSKKPNLNKTEYRVSIKGVSSAYSLPQEQMKNRHDVSHYDLDRTNSEEKISKPKRVTLNKRSLLGTIKESPIKPMLPRSRSSFSGLEAIKPVKKTSFNLNDQTPTQGSRMVRGPTPRTDEKPKGVIKKTGSR
jgi:hypothetical protein